IGDSLKLKWGELERKLRRRRGLRKKGKLGPEESSELKTIERQLVHYRQRAQRGAISAWLKRHPVPPCSLDLVVLLVVSGLAVYDGLGVRNGNSHGRPFGLFGYRAEQVSVCPASKAGEKTYGWLAGKQAYLLGGTAQNVVLYLPATYETMRVPVSSVIVT